MTVIDAPALGIRFEIRRNDPELAEFDVVGRTRGFLLGEHVHSVQTERFEMLDGSMRIIMDGREHVLEPGDAIEIPAGTPHRQLPAGAGDGRVRVQHRPGGRTVELLERFAAMRLNRWGYPWPRDGLALVRDFPESRPVLPLRLPAAREYAFVDEWDVAAPRDAVFSAISDARSYPAWWKPVYIAVEADGEPAVGKVSRQHFKGRLPYHLRTRSRITRLEPPQVIGAEVDGDLRGTGLWTLTEIEGGTHVRFDWRVHADRPLLRLLTPMLRRALRWNHAWAIARAREGLEPYARAAAARVPTTAR
jgi:uncharacterized protein YndB with AHSA1/START domain